MLLSISELQEIWNRDKANFLKRPSIDRRDSSGHYSKKNCRFIELRDNIQRAWKERRQRQIKCREVSTKA